MNQAKKVKQKRQEISKYKKAKGCENINCPYGCNKPNEVNPAILTFHHKEPNKKINSVSKMIKLDYSIEKIMTEVEKCIVLCANCHIEHHTNENNFVIEDL